MVDINRLQIVNLIEDQEIIKSSDVIKLTLNDLNSIPELAQYISLERFIEQEVEFNLLTEKIKLKVGELFLKKDKYLIIRKELLNISWVDFNLVEGTSKEQELLSIRNSQNPNNLKLTLWEDCQPETKMKIIYLYFGINQRSVKEIQKKIPNQVQNLTDIDLNYNKFNIITSVEEFFFKVFSEYLKVEKGDIPFMNDCGSSLDSSIQTKNTSVRQIEIEYDLNEFIDSFNNIYNASNPIVVVNAIEIINLPSINSGDSWIIDISARIINEDIIFRIQK